MQQLSTQSRELLTARQVQGLLHIDRSTVYRMAGDGRLPAIRVGKQLRFPVDQLGMFLGGEATQVADGLDPDLVGAAIEVAADLLGVTMVVTDMTGRPITPVVNPSPWFIGLHDDHEQLQACLDEWRALADDPDLAPRFVPAAAGFECARAFIRSGSALIGMVLAGGVAPPEQPRSDAFHNLDQAQREQVLRALPRIAATLGSRAARRFEPKQMKETP